MMVAKEITKEEQTRRFNRQINFFIMRHMWQVICGRSGWHTYDTIYDVIDIRRERFTRVIDTGVIRYGKGEIDRLVELTGVWKGIFQGDIHFQCVYTVGQGANPSKESITDEEWAVLFNWRSKMKNAKKKLKEAPNNKDDTPEQKEEKLKQAQAEIAQLIKGKDIQEKIYKKLERVKKAWKERENEDFSRLCYFLKERKAAPVAMPAESIRDFERAAENLSFDLLEQCNNKTLKKIYTTAKDLEKHALCIMDYRAAKAHKRKKLE